MRQSLPRRLGRDVDEVVEETIQFLPADDVVAPVLEARDRGRTGRAASPSLAVLPSSMRNPSNRLGDMLRKAVAVRVSIRENQ